jgi:polysaccharide export outer membrane protein
VSRIGSIIPVILLALPLVAPGAEGYEIGVGDLLEIEVWQQPELSTTVTVYSDGTVILPVIGSVKVEGMHPTQAATLVSRRLSTFNPRISQVTVRVAEFHSKSIFVLGEVASPGKYGFEVIPDLVAVVTEAGGFTEAAALSELLIVRASDSSPDSWKERKTLRLDLENIVNEGNLHLLPTLRPGDVVWVPRRSGYAGGNRVSIYGEVYNPGVYAIGSNADFLDVILLAGGPTEQADLGRIRLMRAAKGFVMVDLDSYLKRGERNLIPRLNPNDVVVVSREKEFWPRLWDGFREAVIVLAAVAEIYWIYDRLQD